MLYGTSNTYWTTLDIEPIPTAPKTAPTGPRNQTQRTNIKHWYCMQLLLEVATALGCPECLKAFKEGTKVQPICLAGRVGKEQCQAVSTGGNFG